MIGAIVDAKASVGSDALNRLLSKLHSSQARIVAGVALMAALVNGLAPDPSLPFDAGKAATIAAAAVVWLYSEIGSQRKPSDADIALYRRTKELLDAHALSFLKKHDFGMSLRDDQTSPVGEICSWDGADSEFRDSKVQKSWKECRANLEALNRLYAEKLGPASKPDRLSSIPPGIDDWDLPDHLGDAVNALNSGASKAYASFNDFDRIAKERLDL